MCACVRCRCVTSPTAASSRPGAVSRFLLWTDGLPGHGWWVFPALAVLLFGWAQAILWATGRVPFGVVEPLIAIGSFLSAPTDLLGHGSDRFVLLVAYLPALLLGYAMAPAAFIHTLRHRVHPDRHRRVLPQDHVVLEVDRDLAGHPDMQDRDELAFDPVRDPWSLPVL